MSIIGYLFEDLVLLYLALIPVIWLWIFYHEVRCRKVNGCKKRKCKYWDWCKHTRIEPDKDKEVLKLEKLLRSVAIMEEPRYDENENS